MKFEMSEIPSAQARGWRLKVDGVEVVPRRVELSSKFGEWQYGRRPEGYDSWVFREAGSGGVITLPYARTPEGELLVGLLREKRANMGDEPVWCIIGGFLNPGETNKQALDRETAEEAGLDTMKAGELPGPPINWNRAFMVADPNAGEGDHAYSLEIPFSCLEPDGEGCWRLKDTVLLPNFKKGGDVRFFPWHKAVGLTADALALAAIAKLLAREMAD